jgi:cysteine desulfurase / selenocysteine lyase
MFSTLEADQIKQDFPILKRQIRPGIPLVYLDSAATSQKPEQVISIMDGYYRTMNANIHRGVHTLAEEATYSYEEARDKLARFIGAASSKEVIFTRNTTEAINLVACTWGRSNLKKNDLVLLTEMEHHSNLVPWHILQGQIGFRLEFIPITDQGFFDLGEYDKYLKQGPRLVAFTHMSNVLGTINPAKELVEAAHKAGAITLIDGAQSVPHFPVNVCELGTDFLAFSAHKMCGPTGVGVLYGRKDLLENLPPFMGGGDMIKKVFLRSFTPNDLPHKFEAGTPAIAEAIGFGTAADYLNSIGMDQIAKHERSITTFAMRMLSEIKGLKIIGPPAENKGGVVSFTLEGIHPHDVAQLVDRDGIAVRAGHHCAMPLHEKFGLPATTRASFYLYNTEKDVDSLVQSLHKVIKLFNK